MSRTSRPRTPRPRTPRIRRAATGALIAIGTLFASVLPTGAAGAAPHPAPNAASATRLASFWTPERMRTATPLDLLPVQRGALSETVRSDIERLVKPTRPGLLGGRPGALPQTGAPWTGGGAHVKTTGRVFFTYQGRQASCSGDAVTSANKSTVITAGHCVKLDGAWHTHWVFVPGYHDGQAPYGKWAAEKTLSTPQWTKSEDINFDVGAAVVAPLDGKKLTDVVGGQGLAFNSGYRQRMYAFGFPAAAPYDGSRLVYCSGTTIRDPLLSKDHGLPCNMTGGSSGGPWFTSFDESTGRGLQASVNSFTYQFLPDTMFGPYFGDDAKNLYTTAQSS
ncbi:trypsin-like serine peptidase [Streptomyces gilvosporeus]|uniref:Peptidase n=1 Tax=Streptomyces gilvosporeus TaxID=553510 RepID=A0A1V0TQ72_9ACTN|nr:peptidase [Streptomyces gilvosporeus]ARF55053.1 peptidase [Streptomyces gilvosporeus]